MALTVTLDRAAPAHAAAGPGTGTDIELGAIDAAGGLTWSGTVSCSGTSTAVLVVTAHESGVLGTSGTSTQDLSCPTTGTSISGALAPSQWHTWSRSGTVTWSAKIKSGPLHLETLSEQNGDEDLTVAQDNSVAVDSGTVDANGDAVLAGVYECTGTGAATLTETLTMGSVRHTADIAVSCPTSGPTSYRVTVPANGRPFHPGPVRSSMRMGGTRHAADIRTDDLAAA
ncbi:hypothetical protein [Kitasatospora purpeofusca]|uniref:hypothetical protein n=1 Tax=Kitasatospora purpeofusca TaxID=67352 RepID=UPI00365933DE